MRRSVGGVESLISVCLPQTSYCHPWLNCIRKDKAKHSQVSFEIDIYDQTCIGCQLLEDTKIRTGEMRVDLCLKVKVVMDKSSKRTGKPRRSKGCTTCIARKVKVKSYFSEIELPSNTRPVWRADPTMWTMHERRKEVFWSCRSNLYEYWFDNLSDNFNFCSSDCFEEPEGRL